MYGHIDAPLTAQFRFMMRQGEDSKGASQHKLLTLDSWKCYYGLTLIFHTHDLSHSQLSRNTSEKKKFFPVISTRS